MDNTQLILGLLETVIGRGKRTSNKNYAYHCPFCNHKKPKLEINLEPNTKGDHPWHCWVCEAKGKSIESLFKRLKVSSDKLFELRTYTREESGEMQGKTKDKQVLTLPAEFITLAKPNPKSLTYRHAIHYLTARGVTIEDVVKYNLGYCETGKYANKIIVPSYGKDGSLNFFTGRSFEKDPAKKYDAPRCDKNAIIGFENLINWEVPIILCEGPFDALAIKRNVIPLFGKIIPTALKLKLAETTTKTIYLALDKEVIDLSIQYAEELINLGKEVYIVELDGKDPSDIGFEHFTTLLHTATPLTFRTILSRKLKLS